MNGNQDTDSCPRVDGTDAFAQHEARCRRCLQCCYRKAIIDEVMYQTPFPCEYLDVAGRRCTVYEKRHDVCPQCLTISEAIRIGVLPADCLYIEGVAGYRAPEPLPDAWMDELGLRALGEALDVSPELVNRVIADLTQRGELYNEADVNFF